MQQGAAKDVVEVGDLGEDAIQLGAQWAGQTLYGNKGVTPSFLRPKVAKLAIPIVEGFSC